MTSAEGTCPCGRPRTLAECCGPYVASERPAPDPESLMRSRYTAFALGTPEALEYLIATHHPSTRGPNLRAALRSNVAAIDAWLGLEVRLAHARGNEGVVEFEATYLRKGERGRLRERSEFLREGGRWLYVRGDV